MRENENENEYIHIICKEIRLHRSYWYKLSNLLIQLLDQKVVLLIHTREEERCSFLYQSASLQRHFCIWNMSLLIFWYGIYIDRDYLRFCVCFCCYTLLTTIACDRITVLIRNFFHLD